MSLLFLGQGGGQSRPTSKNSKKSFQRSESFQQQQQQSHFFVNTQMDEIPTGKHQNLPQFDKISIHTNTIKIKC